LRIDYNKAEERLKTTPCSKCGFDALAIDEPLDICSIIILPYYIIESIFKVPFLTFGKIITGTFFLSYLPKLKECNTNNKTAMELSP